MSAPVALALAAWVCFDLTLLLALVGFAFSDRAPGDRLFTCLAILTVIFGANAYALDSFQRYFNP